MNAMARRTKTIETDECVILRPSICVASCHYCQQVIDGPVHTAGRSALGLGFFCESCCPVHAAQLPLVAAGVAGIPTKVRSETA